MTKRIDTQRRQPRDNGGRNWSGAATSQGMPRMAGGHQELEGARRDPPLQP